MNPGGRAPLLMALGVVLVGLAGRALIDKILALRGGAELVAHWAQLTSLADVISGVTLAGIGVGMTGRVANSSPSDQRRLLAESLRLGLLVSGACLLLAALPVGAGWLQMLPGNLAWLAYPALVAGWLTIAPGLLSGWLLGRGRPGQAMLLAAATLALPVVALGIAARGHELLALLAAQALTGLALSAPLLRSASSWTAMFRPGHELRPFIGASLAIGILSPAATAFARHQIGISASWETAGAVQALWRSSEWITLVVAGLIYAHYLPRMAVAADAQAMRKILRDTLTGVLLPALAALAVLWALLPDVLALLYRADILIVRSEALAFFAGDGLRMFAWVFHFALFARSAGKPVTLGEFLSLPLFAFLVWLLPGTPALRSIGLCWLGAYACYAGFNVLAFRRESKRWSPTPPR